MKMKMTIPTRPSEAHADVPANHGPACRFCGAALRTTFVDLGLSPLCQSVIRPEDLRKGERFYPLHVYVCAQCFLVQLPQVVAPDEIFGEYAYFSSYSSSRWSTPGATCRRW
jgi:hypothetical protein